MNETYQSFLLSLALTFLLCHCCYGNETKIERTTVSNSFNFTDSYTTDNVTTDCPKNSYALAGVSGLVKCFSEDQISDNSTKGLFNYLFVKFQGLIISHLFVSSFDVK